MDQGDPIAHLMSSVLATTSTGVRTLVAIAGPPASGKSTLAEDLVAALNAAGVRTALVPMDGFHLDNRLLEPAGLLSRKGAPETFDATGFVCAMHRLRSDPEVILPTFDRTRDLSVAGAIRIGPEDRIAVVEGNYLCFAERPWDSLAELWDFSAYLDVPEEILLERLVRRWLDHGHTPEAAEARARGNDLANAQRIRANVTRHDLTI